MRFPSREQVTSAVLKIVQPDYADRDFNAAMKSWWQNIRSTGGFGLTYAGSKSFELAGLDFEEFETKSSPLSVGFAMELDKKMPVPYYRYTNKGAQRVKIYDERISLLVILYDTIDTYLSHLEPRHK